MRAAIIDIGSSSIKLIIGEKDEEAGVRILESLKNGLDIGNSTFYQGRISQEIITETVTILEKYKQILREYNIEETKVIATTAVREARNREMFIDVVLRKTGFAIEVLNVGDVVYFIDTFLSYKLKKSYPINEKNILIAELGAGSLDISIMERGFTLANIGAPIGTLRVKQFKNKINASQSDTYLALCEYIEKEILSLKRRFSDIKIDDVIIIDESYGPSLRKILPNEKREKSFFKFTYREAKQFLSKITPRNLDDLAHKYELPLEVSDSIDGYGVILLNLFRFIKGRSIYILETSLSEALLANSILGFEKSNKYNKSNQLVSVAKYLCQKYDADIKHGKHVAFLSEQIFKFLKDSLGLAEDDLLYVILASYLHNIGLLVNNRSHHKHSEYIINSLSLFRLLEEEIKIIACVSRYHRKATPQKSHFLYNSLSQDAKILVQKLSAILRMANALDSSQKQKVKKLETTFNRREELNIVVYSSDNFTLEKVNFLDSKKFFEEITGNKVNLIVKKV